jgi:iduronate 2-sulfatase
MRFALVSAACIAAFAQPPCGGGSVFDGQVMPGMPVPINTTELDADGQQCAFLCWNTEGCVAFNSVSGGCNDAKWPCPADNKGGCCWLLSSASSANSTSANGCACSAMVRPDPSSVPPLPPATPPKGAKNILYVLVDDFRPDLQPFGATFMHTPNLAQLASRSTMFNNAYCNIAVCSPSRMSFLTGRYPSHTSTWNFVNHVRQATCTEAPGKAQSGTPYKTERFGNGGAGQCCTDCDTEHASSGCVAWDFVPSGNGGGVCNLYSASSGLVDKKGSIAGGTASHAHRDWVTLPQYFTQAGYFTQATGKIFHTEEGGSGPMPWDGQGMPPLQDPISWSRGNSTMASVNAMAPMRDCNTGTQDDSCSVAGASLNGDVPVGTFTFCDRTVRDDAIAKLDIAAQNLQSTGTPFLLAVGFRKPHLPFRHPEPYNAFYPLNNISLAKYKTMDKSVPPIAFHQTHLAQNPYVPMADDEAAINRRDYYAAISWMDYNLGLVLQKLDDLGLTNDTLIVFHADHGWSLGEHGEWEKFSNWEHGTRVPLLVSAPWIAGSAGARTDALVSLIDVYPTMAELAGLPVPQSMGLDGQSRASLLLNGGKSLPNADAGAAGGAPTDFALSVYPRCPQDLANVSMYWSNNDCLMTERATFPFMGVSLRVQDWRYTEWLPWNGSALLPSFNSTPVGIELYSHAGDDGTSFDGPFEVVNLAGQAQYAQIQQQLAAMMRAVYPY